MGLHDGQAPQAGSGVEEAPHVPRPRVRNRRPRRPAGFRKRRRRSRQPRQPVTLRRRLRLLLGHVRQHDQQQGEREAREEQQQPLLVHIYWGGRIPCALNTVCDDARTGLETNYLDVARNHHRLCFLLRARVLPWLYSCFYA